VVAGAPGDEVQQLPAIAQAELAQHGGAVRLKVLQIEI
jgi:hypothetical protein